MKGFSSLFLAMGLVLLLSISVLAGCRSLADSLQKSATIEKYVTRCAATFDELTCMSVDGDVVSTSILDVTIEIAEELEGTMLRGVYDPRFDYNWDFKNGKPLSIGYATQVTIYVRNSVQKEEWENRLNQKGREPQDVLPTLR